MGKLTEMTQTTYMQSLCTCEEIIESHGLEVAEEVLKRLIAFKYDLRDVSTEFLYKIETSNLNDKIAGFADCLKHKKYLESTETIRMELNNDGAFVCAASAYATANVDAATTCAADTVYTADVNAFLEKYLESIK